MKGPFLVGADPELFLRNTQGKFVSAYGYVPGTKKQPHAVSSGAVQLDGMAAEFNIAPAKNSMEFVHNIQTVLSELSKMIPEDLELATASVAHFDPEHLATMPPEVLELGCDPDYSAYTRTRNPRPDQHPTMRTASGHVHIGYSSEFEDGSYPRFMECCDIVKQLDFYLGLSSIVLDEAGAERRQMYGQAGCFRPKSYGVEYRVLSNFWLNDEKLMRFVYNRAMDAVRYMDIMYFPGEFGDIARDIIAENNKHRALEILKVMDLDDEILSLL